MIIILDTSAILAGIDPGGDFQMLCPPGVIDELQSSAAHDTLEKLRFHGLRCQSPGEGMIDLVRSRATELGENHRLSETDIQVLALALETKGVILSDDYSIQNLAAILNIPYRAVGEDGISHIRSYRYRCKGCGKFWETPPETNDCPICGAVVRSVPDRKHRYLL